jgi:hypothetical protein
MKKPLLIVLACLLCFFIGYYAGGKSKPVNKRFNNPYRMGTMPKRTIPAIKNLNKLPATITPKNKIKQPKIKTAPQAKK